MLLHLLKLICLYSFGLYIIAILQMALIFQPEIQFLAKSRSLSSANWICLYNLIIIFNILSDQYLIFWNGTGWGFFSAFAPLWEVYFYVKCSLCIMFLWSCVSEEFLFQVNFMSINFMPNVTLWQIFFCDSVYMKWIYVEKRIFFKRIKFLNYWQNVVYL